MRDFFVRLGDSIKNWAGSLIERISRLLVSLPTDKCLHYIAGLVISLPFAFLLPYSCRFLAAVPPVFAGLVKECIDLSRGGSFDWFDALATSLGGATVVLFALIPSIG